MKLGRPALLRLLSLAVTLVVWEWYGRGVDPIFMSYPSAIIAAISPMVTSGELPRAMVSSLGQFAVGFGLAIVFGVLVGVVTGRYRTAENLVDLQISALYATPNVALIPLFMLWFGLGATAKIFIIFMAAFFPIVVTTQAGVRNVSASLVDIVLAEGGNEWQVLTKVVVPASLPFVMGGIRLGVGRAVVGMVVAEMFTAITGLGGLIVTYGNHFQTDRLFVVIICLACMGVGLTEGFKRLEHRFARWKSTERAQ